MENSIQNQNENKNKNIGAGLVYARGITLIALVFTIIILIILAGVTINLSLGGNGLFNKAVGAKEEYRTAANEEQAGIANIQGAIDNITGGGENEEDLNQGAVTLVPGLYDANGLMLCTWDESGIDVELDYYYLGSNDKYFGKVKTSPYYVINNFYPTTTQIVMPKGVERIGNYVFYSLKNLTNVVIPEGVKDIGTNSFYNCNSLINTIIPSSVETIGDNAFTACTGEIIINCAIPDKTFNADKAPFYNCKFTKVTINNSIGDYAFYNNTTLSNVILSKGVTYIGISAFRNCSSLTSMIIPESVISIGDRAFQDCTNFINIVFSENSQLISIGDAAFYKCIALENILIPQGVTSIGKTAFSGCTSLKNTFIPSSIQTIGNQAFHNCTGEVIINCAIPSGTDSNSRPLGSSKFTKVTINNSIGDYAFYGCDELTTVILLDGVTSIGSKSFCSCSGVGDIIIPSSVTSIGNYAFQGCSKLTNVVFKDIETWYVGSLKGETITALSSSDLSDTLKAASYLNSTYNAKYWTKQ